MNTVSRNRSKLATRSLLAALCAGAIGVGMSTACLAGPYVVAKAGTTKWEDFEGDDTDTYASLGVGFNGNEYFSFEIAYNDLGEVAADDAGDVTAEAYSTSVAGLLRWPMSSTFGVFLKLGLEA